MLALTWSGVRSHAAQAIIVSERSNAVDEALYAGIVHFVAYEQIAGTLLRLPAAAALHQHAVERRRRFRLHFAPADILRRANATARFEPFPTHGSVADQHCGRAAQEARAHVHTSLLSE